MRNKIANTQNKSSMEGSSRNLDVPYILSSKGTINCNKRESRLSGFHYAKETDAKGFG